MKKLVYGLGQLMRPMEWTKSFGNMVIAAVTVGVMYGVLLEPIRFLLGFASLALLWSGLYTLNDYTDRKADALHETKKNRPIPSGKVSANAALGFAIVLVAASLGTAYYANGFGLLMVCVLAMLANQLMYTMKPFSFKKRPVVDLISGSLVNPIFRFYAGWVLFMPAFNAPLSVLVFILGFQFGGYNLYRMASKGHEKKLGLKNSAVMFGKKNMRVLSYIALAIGALAYIYATLTVLPIAYLGLGLIMLLATPFYLGALKDPEAIDMKKMYWLIYIQYAAFILGFILLYLISA